MNHNGWAARLNSFGGEEQPWEIYSHPASGQQGRGQCPGCGVLIDSGSSDRGYWCTCSQCVSKFIVYNGEKDNKTEGQILCIDCYNRHNT